MTDEEIRKAYDMMFGDGTPSNLSIEQMREAIQPPTIGFKDRVRQAAGNHAAIADATRRDDEARYWREMALHDAYDPNDPKNYAPEFVDLARRMGMSLPELTEFQREQGSIQPPKRGLGLREALWQGAIPKLGLQGADRLAGRPVDAADRPLSIFDFIGGSVLDAADAVSKGSEMGLMDAATVGLAPLDVIPMVGMAGDVGSTLANRSRELALRPVTYATHEAAPYAAVAANVGERNVGLSGARHLPGVLEADPAAAEAFRQSRSWADPETGKDILLSVAGGDVMPTLRGQGVYAGPRGVEFNPLSVARVEGLTPEQLQATESLRGLLDVQGGTPWTTIKGGNSPAIFIPHADEAGSKADLEALMEVGRKFNAPDVMDVGDGYIMTNFDAPETAITGLAARKAIKKATGMRGTSVDIGGGYPWYEGAWEGGSPSAIRQYLAHADEADQATVEALQASPQVREAAQKRAMLNFQQGKDFGGSNPDVDEMLRSVSRPGADFGDGLRSYSSRMLAREIAQQPPVLPKPGGDYVNLTHFSDEVRKSIDPSYKFSNPRIVGAERSLPAPYPAQSYFGVDEGLQGGYVKEGALGDIAHTAALPRSHFLDIGRGFPQDISGEADAIISRIAETRKSPMTAAEIDKLRTAYMMQIAKQRGYAGLLTQDAGSGPIATSFYPVEVSR